MTKNKVLQKFLAEAGYCSRRQAEELIKQGRVQVNGETAEPGRKVENEDEVRVDGRVLSPLLERIYIKLNKPVGYTCTNKKFPGEKNVFDLVEIKEKLFVVGRLDKDSRGLVILTNDGDWANRISHPSFGCEKEYLVKLKVPPFAKATDGRQNLKFKTNIKEKMLSGIDIGDGDGVVSAKKVKKIKDNSFEIVLTQGKKRQIRRMFQALGAEVEDLKRVRIDGIKIGNLKEGKWEFLKNKEVKNGNRSSNICM